MLELSPLYLLFFQQSSIYVDIFQSPKGTFAYCQSYANFIIACQLTLSQRNNELLITTSKGSTTCQDIEAVENNFQGFVPILQTKVFGMKSSTHCSFAIASSDLPCLSLFSLVIDRQGGGKTFDTETINARLLLCAVSKLPAVHHLSKTKHFI